ncbi:hypothetical protein V1389_12415 [Flavobacterium rakeshii]|uniref:hypothetical protein n=1 Tax=Flavobacterium rakeshii TaxID=1038845 RepID=UPI002E7B1B55|nr:hypothetical protein [Flavobacterium rakeshii]MEE1899149.1 hypothetical protein [Flavobacterium rakeshii]
MKKLKLFLGVFLFTLGVSAGEKDTKLTTTTQKEGDVTRCCTRTVTSGEPKSLSYVSVTVTKCNQSSDTNTAAVAACNNAQIAANNAVAALKDTSVTVKPN